MVLIFQSISSFSALKASPKNINLFLKKSLLTTMAAFLILNPPVQQAQIQALTIALEANKKIQTHFKKAGRKEHKSPQVCSKPSTTLTVHYFISHKIFLRKLILGYCFSSFVILFLFMSNSLCARPFFNADFRCHLPT